MLSEKRSIEEKLEILERQSIYAAGDSHKRTASDLSNLPYQEIGYNTNGVGQNVSWWCIYYIISYYYDVTILFIY